MTTEQMYAVAISALAGVVVILWKAHGDNIRDLKKRVNDCEQDRANLWTEVKKLMGGPATDP